MCTSRHFGEGCCQLLMNPNRSRLSIRSISKKQKTLDSQRNGRLRQVLNSAMVLAPRAIEWGLGRCRALPWSLHPGPLNGGFGRYRTWPWSLHPGPCADPQPRTRMSAARGRMPRDQSVREVAVSRLSMSVTPYRVNSTDLTRMVHLCVRSLCLHHSVYVYVLPHIQNTCPEIWKSIPIKEVIFVNACP